MSRIKGSRNKLKSLSKMSPEDRIKVFANLIIDRILEEQENGDLERLAKFKGASNE